MAATVFSLYFSESKSTPPTVPYSIPFIGSAIEYGMDPVKFLLKYQQKFGNVYSFLMLGRKMTVCLGPQGNNFVFNIPLASASAEGAYATLTVPVFGSEVVYDVPNPIFMEQKKFVKDALSAQAFNEYMPIIHQEVRDFFKGMAPDASRIELETFEAMSELTIRTATHCLMGTEIRDGLRVGHVTKLYHDLDAGLAPINVFFKWLPLPTYFARDNANMEMTKLFKSILKNRRANNDSKSLDVLNALMDAQYKSGEKMSDDAISHLMIALLLGGQHTSSTTSSWMLFELSRRPDIVEELLKEQSTILTGVPDTPISKLPDIEFDNLKELPLLDAVMKETLRLHAPIHTIMRKVEKEIVYNGSDAEQYTIPVGHFLCAAPQISQLDEMRFEKANDFDPYRHLIRAEETVGEWNINNVDIAQKSAKSHFLPFGAGRHRCIGEQFAYCQNKTIVALFLREFEMSTGKMPKPDYTSLIVVPEKKAKIMVKRREV